MNRYPAFHATYYKRAYNYRNYFDYPWHAELHEPSSLFSYETVADNESTDSFAPVLDPGEQTLPPAPVPVVPVSAAYRNAPRPAATAKQPIMPVKQASTLAPIVHIARPEQPILAPIISVQEVAKPQLPLEDAETASTKLLRTLRR